jgi:hypothetical protein
MGKNRSQEKMVHLLAQFCTSLKSLQDNLADRVTSIDVLHGSDLYLASNHKEHTQSG